MREDILRILKNILRRKIKSQSQNIDFDQNFTFYKIREEKEEKILQKTREKKENSDIKIMIFREELDLLWFFQNQWT